MSTTDGAIAVNMKMLLLLLANNYLFTIMSKKPYISMLKSRKMIPDADQDPNQSQNLIDSTPIHAYNLCCLSAKIS